jgi:hypothetical protein
MAFDYTLPASVFAYGSSAGTSVDPVNEAAVMASLVTAMSRAIDTYCSQNFSLTTYTLEVYRAVIDMDGILTCYPPVPTMSLPTAADWRLGRSSAWSALQTANLDVETNTFGCVLRNVNSNLLAYRGARVEMRVSYSGGYANLASLPSDFEWAMRGLCWWAYQKRSAPTESTAIPDLGVLIIPGTWPQHLKQAFRPYTRQVVM